MSRRGMKDYEPHRSTYDSIADIAAVAIPHIENGNYSHPGGRWEGFRNTDHLRDLAINGWGEEAAKALDIAESAVDSVTKETDVQMFHPVWDVTGSEVDVARYLSGEPENMIEYEMVDAPRNGRVITLVVATSVSASISSDTIKRRGYGIAALAFALSRMGLSTEIWADLTTGYSGKKDSARVLVKGTNDELDPARIMFACAHTAMFRGLMMPSQHTWPWWAQKRNKVGNGYGRVDDPIRDMPQGTLYLPSLSSFHDVPDAPEALMGYLRQLGIIE